MGREGSLQVNDELDGDDIEPARKSFSRDLNGYGERRTVALCSKHRSPKILPPSGFLKLSQYLVRSVDDAPPNCQCSVMDLQPWRRGGGPQVRGEMVAAVRHARVRSLCLSLISENKTGTK